MRCVDLQQSTSSQAQAQAPASQSDNSPFRMPPTPSSPLSPCFTTVDLSQRPAAAPRPAATSAQATAPVPKVEEEDRSPTLGAIPELGNVDVSGVLEIIDLTRDDEFTESPMQLTGDLPPLVRRSPDANASLGSEERKRVPEAGWNRQQDAPNKRRRTEDHVTAESSAASHDGATSQDTRTATGEPAGEGAPMNEFQESILRSLMEVAQSLKAGPEVSLPPVELEPASAFQSQSEGEWGAGPTLAPGSSSHGEVTSDPPSAPAQVPAATPNPNSRQARPDITPANSSAPAPASIPQSLSSSTPLPPRPSASSPVTSVPPPSLERAVEVSARPASSTRPAPPPLSVPPPTSALPQPRPSVSASASATGPQAPPITPVTDALAGFNLSLPSPTNAVRMPSDIGPSAPPKPKKLSIAHIDLIYRRLGEGGQYLCRLCEYVPLSSRSSPVVIDTTLATVGAGRSTLMQR